MNLGGVKRDSNMNICIEQQISEQDKGYEQFENYLL
jgi:hypothetical protein